MPDLSNLIFIPEPAGENAFVALRAFETGRIRCAQDMIVEGDERDLTMPSWRFYVSHAATGTRMWFDMGIAPTVEVYPPAVRILAESLYRCEVASTTPLDDQRATGDDPNDVEYIIASHAHWDHMFPVGEYFPRAKLLCGPGTLELTSQSYPRFANSPYDAHIWDPLMSDLPIWDLPSPTDYPSKWQKLGPFEHAHDFLGDGSFWLINAPGHVVGNIAALCSTKTTSGRRAWVLLAADCMHSCHYLEDPEAPFHSPTSPGISDRERLQLRTVHAEPEKAHALAIQITEFKRENPGSAVWLGHAADLESRPEIDMQFR